MTYVADDADIAHEAKWMAVLHTLLVRRECSVSIAFSPGYFGQ